MILSKKIVASQLLKSSGITRVISIDDLYGKDFPIEEALDAISNMEEVTLRAILLRLPLQIEFTDVDIVKTQVRAVWEALTSAQQKQVWASLVSARLDASDVDKELQNDLRAASALPELFDAQILQMLTLKKWEEEKKTLVSEDMPPTLLLVDENFEGEGGRRDQGLDIVAELLGEKQADRIVCALLSNSYHMPTIHSDWKRVSRERGFSRSRFVIIPKDSISDDYQRFLALVKLALFNETAETIKANVNALYFAALDEAARRAAEIDIYEFEQIVCDSSAEEGVWEPETLIRIYSLFHKQETRKRARLSAELHLLSNKLRSVSQLVLADWGSPSTAAVQINKLEWYESADEVNGQLMPTELGDIFQIRGRVNTRYILVAQPCDLTVRAKGNRNGYTTEGLLLEMMPSVGKTISPSTTFSLEFYGDDGSDWHIKLKAAHFVDLNLLDLCAINEEGNAQIDLGAAPSDRLTPSWKARDSRLRKFAQEVVRKFGSMVDKGVDPAEALAIATNRWLGKLFEGAIDKELKSLSYNFSRVGRLRQPRAGALLSRYASNISREAFEHEFAKKSSKTDSKESPVKPD